MDFIDLMGILFDLKDKFPGLGWDVTQGDLTVTLPISQDNAKLLADARKMFEPITGEAA